LPHDHRTHRPDTTPTPEDSPGAGTRAWRRSITNLATTPPRHRPKTTPRHVRHQFLRCSRPLYSSQTTTHTPHTHGRKSRPSGRHRRRRGAGNQRHLTTHHEPTTAPTTAPRKGASSAGTGAPGSGPVVSGPNSAPWTAPPPVRPPPFHHHHDHRDNPDPAVSGY
jgi:hypothetical protein